MSFKEIKHYQMSKNPSLEEKEKKNENCTPIYFGKKCSYLSFAILRTTCLGQNHSRIQGGWSGPDG